MAITRSRKAPRSSITENNNIKSKSEKNENSNSKINKAKNSSKDNRKTSRITKGKNNKKQSIKSLKNHNNNANYNVNRNKKNNNRNGGDINLSMDSINSEIFKAASIDSKGKKLPPYKIEQLQRLQELIKMSSIAKPRGPITFDDNLNRNYNKIKISNSLKLIDKSNKDKVSNITNYDPIRQSYLNNELTESEKIEFKDKFEKIRSYQNIKVPKLSDDIFLKNVLSEIVDKDYGLKFWNYFTHKSEISFGNQTLLNNERKLQLCNSDIIQRKNILNQTKNIKKLPIELNSMEPNENNLKYQKIDIEQVITNTNLETMLNNIPNSFKEIENEEDIFKGLDTQDFTTIREFNFEKI